MGVVYQAIVVHDRGPAVSYAVRGFPAGTTCLNPKRCGAITVVLLPLGHGRSFDDRAPDLVAGVSRQFGRALLVQYDDRIGLRESFLYEDGQQTSAFGLRDELWAPLDAKGEVRMDARRVGVDEFVPGEEYDCVLTAIDRGLRDFGPPQRFDGTHLRELILEADSR